MSEITSAFEKTPIIKSDPIQVRHYQLANGLQLFISVNKEEPRVFTNIAFRAGSKYDPADTTGLAHYMEHMLFKGTSKIGAMDWEQESKYLEQIAALFEEYRQTTDKEERDKIYRQIDSLSNQAAELVAPNEYDQLMTVLGAKDTNAYTWLEQTVYVNDIPSNELKRWMRLESERFRKIALRLFHTELETVYEEFNINQDRDFRKVFKEIRKGLFPKHPYGTQTTIGSPEHLKNPSMRAIDQFFDTWYVPNNMAIILAGDLDPEETVAWAEEYFGSKPAVNLPDFSFEEQPNIDSPVRSEVLGREASYVQLAWRIGPAKSRDGLMASLVTHLLYNEQAGLIDLSLIQEQKVLAAESWMWLYEDYSAIGLYGKPREGQQLEEVEELLLAEVERLRKGDFPEWLIEACIRDLKVGDVKGQVSNSSRVRSITDSYILGVPWSQHVARFEDLGQLTKADIVAWVNEKMGPESFVVVYKREGEDPNVVKVDKPPLTPVSLKREATSDFAKKFQQEKAPRLNPVFADFSTIQKNEIRPGIAIHHVANTQNELFRLDLIFEMGKISDPKLALATTYQSYLGTDKYKAADWQREFFRLGLNLESSNFSERTYISLSGLEESMEEGLQLLVHLLLHAQPDQRAWDQVVDDILQKRVNAKQNRQYILRNAFSNYARFGADSPWRYRLSAAELQQLDPSELVSCLKELFSFSHRIYYYGRKDLAQFSSLLERHYPLPDRGREPLPFRKFVQLPTEKNTVLFTHFPMVQTDLMMVSRGTPQFNLEEYIMRELYNEYFGYGLSSIFFQEIRESRALAYSAYAYYGSPKRKKYAHYLTSYIGTQPDKVAEALSAAQHLLEQMPLVEEMVEQTRKSLIKRTESDRIPERKLYYEAQNVWDLGYQHDLLEDLYQRLLNMTAADLGDFHQKYVKGRPYTLMVLGDRNHVPKDVLAEFGPLEELSLEDLFGY